jgi:CubicO group peptidase (beta-lactamase class C family)
VEDYVASEVGSLDIPGAAVVVVEGDHIDFAMGFGSAGRDRPVTPSTPFHLASVSKSLTAFAIMQQVEAGGLSLEDDLAKLLPEWVAGEMATITVSNLMGHTSGWSEYDGLVNRVNPDLSATALESNVRRIVDTPLSHPVGEFEYSNANYGVLGYLVERVSGQGFESYMTNKVFAPLGMNHSYASETAAIEGGVAEGHYPFLGMVRPKQMVYTPGSTPSSYLAASAEDLGHFLIAHLNDGRYGGRQVLSTAGINRLHQPFYSYHPAAGYAGGLELSPLWSSGKIADDVEPRIYQAPMILDHWGDSESYASSILMVPAAGLGVVVLMNINDESAPSRFHQMHVGIANILLGNDAPPTTQFEGLIDRFARPLLGIATLLFAVRAILGWSRWQRNRAIKSGILRPLVFPTLLDMVLAGGLWWLLVDSAQAPFAVVSRSVPDIVLLVIVSSVILLGWTGVRAMLWMRQSPRD